MKLTNGKYTVEPLGTTLEDWIYNDPSTHDKVTNEWNMKGILFSKEMIDFIKTYNVNDKMPKHLLERYSDVNVNLELLHDGYTQVESYGLKFPQWQEEKFYYASQIDASSNKKTKDTYFIGYMLLVRVVFARRIHLGHFETDIPKEEAIKILIK